MALLSSDLSVSGWNTVFVGTFVASAVYIWILQHRAHPDTQRIMRGFALVILGAAIRIGGWIPWRGFLDIGDVEGAALWKSYSIYWTASGALVMVIGMTVLMWPALKRRWGCMAIPFVILAQVGLFYLGGLGAHYFAKYLF